MGKTLTYIGAGVMFLSVLAGTAYADASQKEQRAKKHADYIQKNGVVAAWKKEEARKTDLTWLAKNKNTAKNYAKNHKGKVARNFPRPKKN